MKSCPTCQAPWENKETITEYFRDLYSKEGIPWYKLDKNPDITVEEAVKETAGLYGCTPEEPKHFGKDVVGIEISGSYDGALYNYCEVCHTYHNRFNGEAYKSLPKIYETP